MKDLPHHMKKLNRRIVRSAHREELAEEEYDQVIAAPSPASPVQVALAPPHRPKRQVKKQAKAKVKKARKARTPAPPTPEERNKKMAKRVPIFDRNKAKPKKTKATRKKTPRL